LLSSARRNLVDVRKRWSLISQVQSASGIARISERTIRNVAKIRADSATVTGNVAASTSRGNLRSQWNYADYGELKHIPRSLSSSLRVWSIKFLVEPTCVYRDYLVANCSNRYSPDRTAVRSGRFPYCDQALICFNHRLLYPKGNANRWKKHGEKYRRSAINGPRLIILQTTQMTQIPAKVLNVGKLGNQYLVTVQVGHEKYRGTFDLRISSTSSPTQARLFPTLSLPRVPLRALALKRSYLWRSQT
jgi:hypothetical protein